ncbi:uncharacterized protein LOC144139115 [Haemaphysalis longicornis]
MLLYELFRLTGVSLRGKLCGVPKEEVAELVLFIRSSSKSECVLEWSLKMEQPGTKLGKENADSICLIPLLVSYFGDDLEKIMQLHEASTELTEEFRTRLP